MPYIVALIGTIFAAYFWANRIRTAGHMANELTDMASDVVAAARRLGFRRRQNAHPVDCTDDPQVITGALAIAFVELAGLPTADDLNSTVAALGRHLNRDLESARELAILGRWLVTESNGPSQSVQRLARRLSKLSGPSGLMPLMAVLKDIGSMRGEGLCLQQKEAVEEIARAFKIA